MELRRVIIQGLCVFVTLYSLSSVTRAEPVTITYASPIGGEKWRMSGNRLRCGLALTIPNYGIAYFEQYAAKPVHFILNKWQQEERQHPAVVFAKPPIWKPGGSVYLISKTTMNPGEYGLYLSSNPSIKMLNYLSQGYQTSFQYLSAQGFPIAVSISPVRFQKVYARYQRCLGSLLSFDYTTVRNTVILFDTDSFELDDKSKLQLQRIAEYTHADEKVKSINIAGYTDDTGRKSYNNAVSELRAKSVKDYLLHLGLQKHVDITWYGIKNPVAPNDSEAGKAANRRVVVDILK